MLLVSQVLGVCAEGSKATAVTSTTTGIVVESISEEQMKNLPEETKAEINDFNAGTLSFESFVQKALGDTSAFAGFTSVGKVFDVHALAGTEKAADGKYHVTFSGIGLKSGMTEKNVKALHFNTEANAWEIMVPESVDTKNNTATFAFKSFSPVLIAVKDVQTTGDKDKKHHSSSSSSEETTTAAAAATTTDAAASATATSPKTGVESTWGLWMAAGLVLAGMAGMTIRTSHKER